MLLSAGRLVSLDGCNVAESRLLANGLGRFLLACAASIVNNADFPAGI